MKNGFRDKSFWQVLPRPIIALAPLANVTDAAFRRIIAKYGKPDVMFTEFVSADGLLSKGRDALLVDLEYSEAERPIVAQLFSGNPEKMYEAAKLVKQLGFDGLDINMGCPDRSIEKSGAGAALIKKPALACAVIRAAKDGLRASDSRTRESDARSIPVSVKTRLGYNKDVLEDWLPELLAEKPAAVTIHARTRKEMSKVPAHWDRVKRAVQIRDEMASESLILGNGDVDGIEDAYTKAQTTGADGIMLGRAIFGNPRLFSRQHPMLTKNAPELPERLRVMVEHTKLFEELLMRPAKDGSASGRKNFAIMKKHFKAYVEGFDGAKELRSRLMETESSSVVEMIVEGFLNSRTVVESKSADLDTCHLKN